MIQLIHESHHQIHRQFFFKLEISRIFTLTKRKDIATTISKTAGRRALKTKFSPPPWPPALA